MYPAFRSKAFQAQPGASAATHRFVRFLVRGRYASFPQENYGSPNKSSGGGSTASPVSPRPSRPPSTVPRCPYHWHSSATSLTLQRALPSGTNSLETSLTPVASPPSLTASARPTLPPSGPPTHPARPSPMRLYVGSSLDLLFQPLASMNISGRTIASWSFSLQAPRTLSPSSRSPPTTLVPPSTLAAPLEN